MEDKGLITFVPSFDNTVCFVRTIRHYSDVNQFRSDDSCLNNGPPFLSRCHLASAFHYKQSYTDRFQGFKGLEDPLILIQLADCVPIRKKDAAQTG